MNTRDYPEGSDTNNSPFNQKDNPEIEVDVLVSITLSKSMKLKLSDYTLKKEEYEGNTIDKVDLSNVNLEEKVREQYYLPDNVVSRLNYIYNFADLIYPDVTKRLIKDLIKDLSFWNTDEIEIIPE